jgi:CubicO group peptidase (beta-lactamase class C family)
MKRRRLVGTLILALSLGQGCGTLSRLDRVSTEAEVARLAASGDLQAEVDTLAQPLIDTGFTPGIVVGVLLPDRTRRVFAYGVRDRSARTKPDGRTLFPVGSISKGFVAAAAAQLVQAGAISWSDTLDRCLPAGTELSPDARRITLLQLATHTAGLPRQPNTAGLFCRLIRYYFTGDNFYRNLDRDYLLRYLAGFSFPEPVRPRYSNIGYAYLSHVMELKTGRTACALVEESVLRPLGLRQTGYTPERLPGWSERALGYAGDEPRYVPRGRRVPAWTNPDALRSSVGLHSSAEDLLTFAAAFLHGSGDARRDAAIGDTLRRRADPPPFAAAVAWTLDDADGIPLAYQTGVMAGFTSYLGLDLEHKTAVVVLQNSLNWTDHIGHKLLLRMARAADGRGGAASGSRSPVAAAP